MWVRMTLQSSVKFPSTIGDRKVLLVFSWILTLILSLLSTSHLHISRIIAIYRPCRAYLSPIVLIFVAMLVTGILLPTLLASARIGPLLIAFSNLLLFMVEISAHTAALSANSLQRMFQPNLLMPFKEI